MRAVEDHLVDQTHHNVAVEHVHRLAVQQVVRLAELVSPVAAEQETQHRLHREVLDAQRTLNAAEENV